jgi:transposase-like protein
MYKANYARKHPDYGTHRALSNPELRKDALELYWGGLGQRAIARHLSIPEGTVYSWVHDFGGQRERIQTSAATRLKPAEQRLSEPETAGEWLEALQELAGSRPIDSECPPIHVVCKAIHGQSEVNQLVTIICDCLRLNALSGEVFAFCNKSRNTIITITWKGTMFSTVKFTKMYGSYLWPREKFGSSITVPAHEFEFLISCHKGSHERQKISKIRNF